MTDVDPAAPAPVDAPVPEDAPAPEDAPKTQVMDHTLVEETISTDDKPAVPAELIPEEGPFTASEEAQDEGTRAGATDVTKAQTTDPEPNPVSKHVTPPDALE